MSTDDEGNYFTLGELLDQRVVANQQQFATERTIADALGEKEGWPRRLIHLVVRHIGTEQSLAFLHETLEIEQHGGMMLPDGRRRWTLGGVFFQLVKEKGSAEIRGLGMWATYRQFEGGGHRGKICLRYGMICTCSSS